MGRRWPRARTPWSSLGFDIQTPSFLSLVAIGFGSFLSLFGRCRRKRLRERFPLLFGLLLTLSIFDFPMPLLPEPACFVQQPLFLVAARLFICGGIDCDMSRSGSGEAGGRERRRQPSLEEMR